MGVSLCLANIMGAKFEWDHSNISRVLLYFVIYLRDDLSRHQFLTKTWLSLQREKTPFFFSIFHLICTSRHSASRASIDWRKAPLAGWHKTDSKIENEICTMLGSNVSHSVHVSCQVQFTVFSENRKTVNAKNYSWNVYRCYQSEAK